MNGWLLDTNVLSELNRPRPAPEVTAFVTGSPMDRLFVSVVTFAEIRFGTATATSAARKTALEHWLARDLRTMFAGRVLALCEDVLLEWRLMARACRRSGRTCSEADLLIAATAAHHDLVLATRDAVFSKLGLIHTYDPWSGTAHQRSADGGDPNT